MSLSVGAYYNIEIAQDSTKTIPFKIGYKKLNAKGHEVIVDGKCVIDPPVDYSGHTIEASFLSNSGLTRPLTVEFTDAADGSFELRLSIEDSEYFAAVATKDQRQSETVGYYSIFTQGNGDRVKIVYGKITINKNGIGG